MAADLAGTPTTTLEVQLCGDAHLSNFGLYASPDRRLVFDLNDFDETHPGPFEWDVKRLAASVEVASRVNGYRRKERRAAVLAVGTAYREHLRRLAKRRNLDVWYERIEYDDIVAQARTEVGLAAFQRLEEGATRAMSRDSIHSLRKLTTEVDGRREFVSDPPLLTALRDLMPPAEHGQHLDWLRGLLRKYRSSLQYDRRILLEQFDVVDVARKVVGVGSVGTRVWVLLLLGRDGDDPLFLQAKEAQQSVLAPYVPRAATFANEGVRVVAGQHVMQAASDIFLGSLRTPGVDGVTRDFYVRQLRDWKLSGNPTIMEPDTMLTYAKICATALARAHARSGDRVALGAYLGSSTTFDTAVAEFASAYADVTEQDHAALAAAVGRGEIEAVTGL